jgi:broad specificity phosphatase PhoE
MTQTIILVRHGQASYGAANYDNLSALGHLQTRALGMAMQTFSVLPDVLVSGAMQRHQQTAQNISENIGVPVEKKQYSAFNEFAFREVVEAFFARYPSEKPAEDAPRTAFYRALKLAMLAWSQGELGTLPESYSQFQQRVVNGLSEVQQDHPHAKQVLVSTSGGVIAMALGHALQLDAAATVNLNLQIYNASLHRILVAGDTSYVSGFNDVAHFAGQTQQLTYS